MRQKEEQQSVYDVGRIDMGFKRRSCQRTLSRVMWQKAEYAGSMYIDAPSVLVFIVCACVKREQCLCPTRP